MSTDPEPVAVAALRLSDPVQVGPHRLLGRLGGGGMGVVYLGDGPLGQVAVKIIRSELADNPSFRVRFQRELQACFRVRGRHTATLLDFDITAEPPWLATQFLAAPTLEQHVARQGPLTEADQLRLAAGLADALVSIHGVGLIHRDLKPSNVMWTAGGPIVIDFGVAAVRDAGQLTVTGTLIGTPGWLSPEQITTGELGAASDLFAWGGLIGYAATGRPPYGEGPPEAITYRIVHEDPRVDYTRIAAPLRDLVRQTLSREPHQRPTAAVLRAALVDALGPDLFPPAGPADASSSLPPGPGTGSPLPVSPPAPGSSGMPVSPPAPGSPAAPGSGPGSGTGGRSLAAAMPPATIPETVHTPSPIDSPPPSIPSPAVGAGGHGTTPGAVGVTGTPGTPPWNISGIGTVGSAASPSGGDAGTADGPGAAGGAGRRSGRRRGRRLLAIGVAVVVLAAAGITVVLLTRGGGDEDGGGSSTFTYTATGPWRLQISDKQDGDDKGCVVSPVPGENPPGFTATSDTVYEENATYQIHQTGDFALDVTPPDPGCQLAAIPGAGEATLPFTIAHNGDSTAFTAPAAVEVEVRDFNGNETCDFVLRDVASGEDVDIATATKDAPTVRLDPGGRREVYLAANYCVVRISAGS
ncbi:Serine-threonine protein kinase (AfsK-like) [Frankia canadensis]|uniref:Serine-threonine protein kinase (AfsK-like) n=1 Tax=Frankia canadensis TaxID=1836972 RepID=A0A2I2KNQ1_9ACTN|nr:serine/threonine-protein kinase [Frankia canadensis]SNQ47272.1 Serine-threonine protein kinase (AfsK-like) [Frankia canadensis]SOU54562.1 Serine-threonine protein kinase (AfsK-like) [Frankia canadensis]